MHLIQGDGDAAPSRPLTGNAGVRLPDIRSRPGTQAGARAGDVTGQADAGGGSRPGSRAEVASVRVSSVAKRRPTTRGSTGGRDRDGAGGTNSALTDIDLDRNRVGDAGASALAAALCHNASLVKLGLALNRIGDSGVEALQQHIAASNTTLLYLKTDANPAHPALVRRLATAVRDNIQPPLGITYPFACVYRYRQRTRRNQPTLLGTPPFAWQIAPALPAGLAFDPASGEISGVPQIFVPETVFTVTATNPRGTSTTRVRLSVDSGVLTGGSAPDAAWEERFKVAFRYVNSSRAEVISKATALEALAMLKLRTSDFDELVWMLDIPLDACDEPLIDEADLVSLARAASSPAPELLAYPYRHRK